MLSKGETHTKVWVFFHKKLTMDDFGKCICIMEHIAYDKKLELKYGDEFLYERYKIKYNTKTKNFKRVRSTQIGDWKFIIANQKGETIYNCDEDWFKDHFDTKQSFREKKLNVLGID